MKTIKLKNITEKKKNSQDGLSSRMRMTENRINKLENL